jgi:cysteine desulfurase
MDLLDGSRRHCPVPLRIVKPPVVHTPAARRAPSYAPGPAVWGQERARTLNPMSLYLDHASTTPMHPAAREAFVAAVDSFADPSRLYGAARRARILLDEARAAVAGSIGARAEEVVFTSGGTESCNLAIAAGARAAAASRKPRRIAVSAVEHTAVLRAAREVPEAEVIEVPVDATGVMDLDALRETCAGGIGLVSVQLANGEVGTLQPVAEAAAIAHEFGALFHTDACAAAGHIPVDVQALGADLVSTSSHKSYGPRGAGALWVRRGVRVRPSAVGDDRERGRRAGIENLPAIAGYAAAAGARATEIAEEAPRLFGLSARLREALPSAVADCEVHGHPTQRLPGIVSFSVLYVEGEALLLALDQRGIAVHSGSSCTSSAQEPSHVLTAMGALTQGSIRVSMGRDTTEGDIDTFLDVLPPIVEQARKLAGV